ncbi:uncharacterized protein [Solanum tuberosum]|uniref:uncharacterized protein n=1 Tax=Solanum tuberosum TaxID=4113 RepID=UPI00073A12AB|nr:PREDICTED: uncharacterized protein LOC107059777 [Solanum tuberosum]
MTTGELDATGNATVMQADTLESIEKKRNHPLYLHPSDTLATVLTTVQLTGTENYSLWSRSMLINLRAKSKLGFVLGTCKRSDYKMELEEQWEKCNCFVLAWIMNTVSKELLSGIVYADDAAEVWRDLKDRFNKVDGSRIYQLHREICTIHQGNLTVSGYYTKMRLLWDEFDASMPPPSCDCDKSRSYIDHLAYLRLFAFLMGLSEVFCQARSQILMMSPLPNVNKAYAMIMADESQRATAGTHSSKDMLESTSLYAGKGQHIQRNVRFPQTKKKNWDQICDYCKLQGHVKLDCFKLNGYPPDWKFKKKPPLERPGSGYDQGMTGQMQGMQNTDRQYQGATNQVRVDPVPDGFAPLHKPAVSQSQGSQEAPSIAAQHTFTPRQYQRLLHMLDKEEATSSGVNSATMAGITGPITTTLFTGVDKDSWIVDSGVTCHMTSKLNRLSSISNDMSGMDRRVHLPNGETISVTHTGNYTTQAGDTLENVLVVPAFKFDLLSVEQLTRQMNCSVNFFPKFVVFQDLSNGKVKGIGRELDGLYYFPSQLPHGGGKNDETLLMTQSEVLMNKMLWHNRMGHPSAKVLSQLPLSFSDTDDICKDCPVCPLAKQTRLPFPLSLSKTSSVFELIHLDVWDHIKLLLIMDIDFS